ncbi:MAG: hypothetical protein NW216_01150 [Hyphomicrobium sp.]|nr:hypothetical protein [Hyphomicrobium sp.]
MSVVFLRPFVWRGLLLAISLMVASCGTTPACPPLLAEARRLIVVTAEGIDSAIATIETFTRETSSGAWMRVGGPDPAVVGRSGLGWARGFEAFAVTSGEPHKSEGDGRAPAGVFRLGPTFGDVARSGTGHMTLTAGEHFCVDDPASPHYGQIVPLSVAGAGTRGEEMWTEPLYRRGIVVDYSSDGPRRSGSCIFIHVWKGAGVGTSGCIALPEARVAALQDFADGATREGVAAVIAILPKSAPALAKCLPGG